MTRLLQKAILSNYTFSIYVLIITGFLAGSVFSANIPAFVLPLLLLPLVVALIGPNDNKSLWYYFSRVASFYIPFHAMVLIWFLNADVSSVMQTSQLTGTKLSLFAIIASVLVMTLAMAPLALFAYLRKIKPINIPISLIIMAGWVVSEFVRSIAFSLFLYGEGGSIGDFWNFGSLGLAFMNTPLAYASTFIGMYGLTFLCLYISISLYYLIVDRNLLKFTFVMMFVIVCLSAGIAYSNIIANHSDPKELHASVQNIKNVATKSLTEKNIKDRSNSSKDLIVLAEYSSTFEPPKNIFADKYVNQRLSHDGISIDVASNSLGSEYGTLQFRNKNGQVVDNHTKKLLIPIGEYLPGIVTTWYRLSGQDEFLARFDSVRKLKKGQPVRVLRASSVIIGPIACSGILSRSDFRILASDGAEVFTNSSSLVLFNRSEAYFRQSLMMARFHSIANSRTYIQASKGAPAFVYNQKGDSIVKPDKLENNFTDFTFRANRKKTFYTMYGEWVLFASIGIIAITFVISRTSLCNLVKKSVNKHILKRKR